MPKVFVYFVTHDHCVTVMRKNLIIVIPSEHNVFFQLESIALHLWNKGVNVIVFNKCKWTAIIQYIVFIYYLFIILLFILLLFI